MTVPFLDRPDTPDESIDAGRAPAGAIVILLVDDELSQRQLFAGALRHNGYYVVEARNGVEALDAAIRAGWVDLVVTDVVMPVMRGPELVTRLRQICPAIQVLFVSGYAEADEVGPDAHFLQKPFVRRDLITRVVDVIGPPRGQDQATQRSE